MRFRARAAGLSGRPLERFQPALGQGPDLLHARVESDLLILRRVPKGPDRVVALERGIDGFSDHRAQQNDALVRRAEMFLGPVINQALALLRHAILVARSDAPPAVVDALVHSRLIV